MKSPIATAAGTAVRLLLVLDEQGDIEPLLGPLRQAGFALALAVARGDAECARRLAEGAFDVVLADYDPPRWRGTDVIRRLRRHGLDIPVILVTGRLGEDRALACVEQGAADCVPREGLGRLPAAVRGALDEGRRWWQRRLAGQSLARAVEELACANRELSRFAGAAPAHLQERLHTLAAYMELLAERYRQRLGAREPHLDDAVETATRVHTMVRDLVAYTRLAGTALCLEPLDSEGVVDAAVRMLGAAIRESGASISCGCLPAVIADGPRLVEVFERLIDNAIKFRSAEEPRVRIEARESRREWEFRVSDNGVGINREDGEVVFEPFLRRHTHGERGGNGIGLAIARRLVERHGGRIRAESTPGAGTTVAFTLPKPAP
jgi:signal transduction histidine kinase